MEKVKEVGDEFAKGIGVGKIAVAVCTTIFIIVSFVVGIGG